MRADDWLKESLGGENGSAYYPGVTQVSQAQFVPIKAASRGRQKIEVTGDNIDSLTISLAPGAGTTIHPGGNIKVQKDGSFEIKSVPDAKYAITVLGLDSDAYVKSVRCRPDNLLEKGLQVEGSFPGKVEVIISSGGAQLEGSVTDNDEAVIGGPGAARS